MERNTLKFAVVSDKKVSEMEGKLDKISVPNKIQLHKQTGDVIYSDLLHSIMKFNKLQSLLDKMEVQLKHEKVENKANLIEIKKVTGRCYKLGKRTRKCTGNQKSFRRKGQYHSGIEKEA